MDTSTHYFVEFVLLKVVLILNQTQGHVTVFSQSEATIMLKQSGLTVY